MIQILGLHNGNGQLEDTITDLESLPWQGAPVEVHEDVSQALHVVPARLLDTQVSVDRGISEDEDGDGDGDA